VDILNNASSSLATEILKKHFHKGSELFKENRLFNVLIESKFKSVDRAEHLVETTIKAFNKVIDKNRLKLEKYNLIKSIKEGFELNEFFKSRVGNYRILAAVNNVLSEDYSNPAALSKNHYTIVENMTSDKKSEETELMKTLRRENKDLRSITYKILIEKFNKKYKSLSRNQKDVLREYINNLSNTNVLNDFLESKFKGISFDLKKSLPKIDDKVIKIKIKECIKLIEDTKYSSKQHSHNVLKLMRFYQLMEDVRNATK
jgi:mRNA-degrading endonuclease RelE of RelBE toxin-antitoxin system